MTADGDCTDEIRARISKAAGAFAMLRQIWNSPSIGLKTKVKIFRSNVQSVLLYGAECWKTTKTI